MDKLIIHADLTKGHIRKTIQGHFSEHLGRCIYGGLYVGEHSDIPNPSKTCTPYAANFSI